jgi:peptide/nickel transport system substrate-binding protein
LPLLPRLIQHLGPLALISWLATAPLLSACQPQRIASDNLVVATRYRVDGVDPAGATTSGALQLLTAIGDPLYAVLADGRVEPRLALAPPELLDGGRTARIQLRRGVLFHDGTTFDAAAMAFSLKRFLAIGKLSYLVANRIKDVRAVDSHTLELSLKRPYGGLATLLSAVPLTPISPTAYRDHSSSLLSDRFVGTGPYRLTYFSNQQQRLEPFPQYWGPGPENDGIDLVSLSNSTALFGALTSGEVDVLTSPGLEIDQQDALHRRAMRGELHEGSGPALEIGYLTLLTDQAPLNNPVLRQAVALSIDRPMLSERAALGLRPPLRSLVPPSLAGGAPSPWPGYNTKKARRLYQQAGYCSGTVLTLPLTFRSNVPSDRLFALTWQAQLRERLGDCVQLEVSGVESTTAYRQLADGAFPIILLDWTGDVPDAENYLAPLLGCDEEEQNRCLRGDSALSGSFWAKPGLQQALERSTTLQGDDRKSLIESIQQQTAEGGAYIPLWLVTPRAWSLPGISRPRFDGSGRLLLNALHRQR